MTRIKFVMITFTKGNLLKTIEHNPQEHISFDHKDLQRFI